MKSSFLRAAAAFACIILLSPRALAARELVPVGEVIGIEIADGSVTIAALDEQLGSDPLQPGDVILAVDGNKVTCAQDVRAALERCSGRVRVTVERDGKEKQLTLTPKVTPDGPKLGIYLKQGVTGVGTVTWYDPDSGSFGALGHGVNDSEGRLLNMESGSAYAASVQSVKKGAVGQPGQLMGAMTDDVPLGKITKNTSQGIFGKVPAIWDGDTVDVASKEQVQTGPAIIRSTVDHSRVQEYSVEILKIYPNSDSSGRNMLLKVTDPALLDATGGIVQGMSGSPILQDGKLVGAVTHVLVNDPTTGYGIFIENMLDAAA